MTWLTWSLLAAFFAAATAILAKLGVEGIDANLATAVRTTVVVVSTWLIAYAAHQPATFQALSTNVAVPSAFGVRNRSVLVCYFRALQVGPASRVAPSRNLSVALVIVFGALAHNELN